MKPSLHAYNTKQARSIQAQANQHFCLPPARSSGRFPWPRTRPSIQDPAAFLLSPLHDRHVHRWLSPPPRPLMQHACYRPADLLTAPDPCRCLACLCLHAATYVRDQLQLPSRRNQHARLQQARPSPRRPFMHEGHACQQTNHPRHVSSSFRQLPCNSRAPTAPTPIQLRRRTN